jgi:hypothetical protein
MSVFCKFVVGHKESAVWWQSQPSPGVEQGATKKTSPFPSVYQFYARLLLNGLEMNVPIDNVLINAYLETDENV